MRSPGGERLNIIFIIFQRINQVQLKRRNSCLLIIIHFCHPGYVLRAAEKNKFFIMDLHGIFEKTQGDIAES